MEENTEVQHNRRGRKISKEKRKGYFYEEEEEAFAKYVQSSDKIERDRLFKEKLYPAFTKMIESIIRRYDLYTPNEDFMDIFCDTMSFLITKVNNFDFTKGYKVYSYCGTVCKNYLIYKKASYIKQSQRQSSYDVMFLGGEKDNRPNDNSKNDIIQLNDKLIKETIKQLNDIIEGNVKIEGFTDNDTKVGYGLIEILTNWEEIFKQAESTKFNKTSFMYFMKEYTRLSVKDIRESMKKYKDLYFFTKQNLLKQ